MDNEKGEYLRRDIHPHQLSDTPLTSGLSFPYPEHLGTASGTCPLSRRLAILHSYGLRIIHFLFGTALYTICLYLVYLLFQIYHEDRLFIT